MVSASSVVVLTNPAAGVSGYRKLWELLDFRGRVFAHHLYIYSFRIASDDYNYNQRDRLGFQSRTLVIHLTSTHGYVI
jgi:hypothetical protein